MSRPGSGERQCSVCRHRERAQIDLSLARGVSAYALAKRFRISTHALYRHAKRHLTAQLRASLIAGPSIEGVDLDKLRDRESQSLLANLVALRHRLYASLETAEEAGDGGMIARVAGQLHNNLEITGRMLGSLGATTQVTNVLIQPQYVTLRIELVKALAPYPEARTAVAMVLHSLEGEAATVIEGESRVLAHGAVQ